MVIFMEMIEKILSNQGTGEIWKKSRELINADKENIKLFIEILMKNLKEDYESNILSLDLLDYFIDNGKIQLFKEIFNQEFLDFLLNIFINKDNKDLKTTILYLIKKWYERFKKDKDVFPEISSNYLFLKSQNLTFPYINNPRYNEYIDSSRNQFQNFVNDNRSECISDEFNNKNTVGEFKNLKNTTNYKNDSLLDFDENRKKRTNNNFEQTEREKKYIFQDEDSNSYNNDNKNHSFNLNENSNEFEKKNSFSCLNYGENEKQNPKDKLHEMLKKRSEINEIPALQKQIPKFQTEREFLDLSKINLYEDSIIDKKEEYFSFICSICFRIVKDPVICDSLNNCDSFFCLCCINEYLKIKNMCPKCHNSPFSMGKMRRTEKGFLETMLVKCPFDCSENVKYSSLKSHFENCINRKEFKKCNLCNEKFSNIGEEKKIEKHLNNCKNITWECPYCMDEISKFNIESHMSSCQQRMVSCERCKSKFPFKLKNSHDEYFCQEISSLINDIENILN